MPNLSLQYRGSNVDGFGNEVLLTAAFQKPEQLLLDEYISVDHEGWHDGHVFSHEFIDKGVGNHRIHGHVFQRIEAEVHSLLESADEGLVKGTLDPVVPALFENRAVSFVAVIG